MTTEKPPYLGPMVITTAGTVIQGVTITGNLVIKAPLVTIRGCDFKAS